MDGECWDRYVMCTALSHVMTGAEVLNVLQKFVKPVSIISCRRAVGTTVYGLAVFLVQFATQEEKEEALRLDLSEDKITVTDVDHLSSHAVLVTGIPRAEEPTFFADMFKPFGASYVQAIENTNGNEDMVVLASFHSNSGCDEFIRLMTGASVCGRKLEFTRLIFENAVRYEATYPEIERVLSEDLDFSLVYYGRVYKCWSGAAIALSEKIGRMAEVDPDISEFVCPMIPGPFDSIYEFFLGREIQINESNCGFVIAMAQEMEIKELYQKAHDFAYLGGDIGSMIPILEQLYLYKLPCQEQLDFVASKLDKDLLQKMELRRYPVELLEMLFASPCFCTDERHVFDFVMSLKDLLPDKCRRLMPHVKIAELPCDVIDKLLEDRFFDLNTLRIGFLERMNNCPYLVAPEPPDQQKAELPKNMLSMFGLNGSFGELFLPAAVFRMRNGMLFDGILSYLCRKVHQNAERAGLIKIIPSSIAKGNPSILIDPDNVEFFGTGDHPDSYIIVDFLEYKVSLTGYSIRTHSHNGNGHITGWKIECENSQNEWLLLDSHDNVTIFNRRGAEEFFPLPAPSPYSRRIKLTQTARNTMGYNNLRLSGLEFFGSLQG